VADTPLGVYGSPGSCEKYARLIAEQASSPIVPRGGTIKAHSLVVQVCAACWDFAPEEENRPYGFVRPVPLVEQLRPM